MTVVPSRNKVANSGRRKQQKLPDPVIVSDEESVEDDSITRCVCGESHSIGLMVCCDQCEVWQHCECMGLEEQEIPEQYFCELCKPSDHVEVKGYDKYYKPCSPIAPDFDKKIPKRRTTFNSREASISIDEVLAFRNAIEIPNANEYENTHSVEDGITVLQDYDENETITTRLVRPKRQTKKSEKKVYTRRPQQQSAVAISPQSTPTPNQTPLFLRENSPPAKVRFPSHRLSIPEMNRRANQILEYISMTKAAMQIDEESSAGTEEYEKENRRPTPILIPGKFDHSSSPSSSLSSASTIPLDDHNLLHDQEKSVAEEALERMSKPKSAQSSMEIMDLLTRDVIKFQRRFGSSSYTSLPEDGNESDGPVTRSREVRTPLF
ncbi:hypothetical protein INT48_006616 [Thamnidium elegans]|uniref:Zinc finger PHD-type domain-containing protein n=1 Tax=Thamnidium elegans TaxID=101142 RepID=A0A8H7SXV0_9FUNG|nr:hypothetical protein INT48_006616 [Thamnidium elegans]